jgi:DNA polymerase
MDKKTKLKSIEQKVFGLQESPLFEYRKSNRFFPVIGEGSHDAKIMMIGEAPGKNEAKTGKPFCGTAGKVLDELLKHIGIERGSIYITNIVKDRPPENRDPTVEEIKVYGPFLDEQIEIIQPKVIVTLGRYAMAYIMKKFAKDDELEPIGKAHGKAYDAKAGYGDIKIVTLYHPCVAVYNPHNLPSLKNDFEIITTIT